jgi:hypothetical protein
MGSLQDSRICDVTPGRRFDSLIRCHGWFHVRMACTEAIWRRHIEATNKKDATGLIAYVMKIRPLEKPKIQSNPTFRQLHEVITHVGIVLRLDAWRTEVSRRYPDISSLEQWLETNPVWSEICEISDELARKIASWSKGSNTRRKKENQRDDVLENTMAYHKDFLLYEETNYSMNHGDIGRLDACLPEWIFYFMGCGKTKYAHLLCHYLENMYIIYPKPLA